MKTHSFFHRLCAVLLVMSSSWSGVATAAFINYSGQLDIVTTDLGGARYSGAIPGQVFSGSFTYGTAAQASTDPLFPGDYDFSIPPFGGSISDGSTATNGTAGEVVQVTIADDLVIDQGTADLINSLLGSSLSDGSIVDIADIDTLFVSPAGDQVVFGLSFISLDGSAWSNDDFSNFPPLSGLSLPAIFFINETDAMDNLQFEGFGVLDSVVVPLPAAAWLLLSGIGLLGLTARRRRAG